MESVSSNDVDRRVADAAAAGMDGDLKKSPARKWVWFLVIGLVAVGALAAALAGAFWTLVSRGVAECDLLEPWPDAGVSVEDAADIELAFLGLTVDQVADGADTYGDMFGLEGTVTDYVKEGTLVARVAVLRFSDSAHAAQQYSFLQSWAQGNCPVSFYASLWERGMIRCSYPESENRIFWNGRWMVDIEATSVGDLEATAAVEKIRDAVASHWKRLLETSTPA